MKKTKLIFWLGILAFSQSVLAAEKDGRLCGYFIKQNGQSSYVSKTCDQDLEKEAPNTSKYIDSFSTNNKPPIKPTRNNPNSIGASTVYAAGSQLGPENSANCSSTNWPSERAQLIRENQLLKSQLAASDININQLNQIVRQLGQYNPQNGTISNPSSSGLTLSAFLAQCPSSNEYEYNLATSYAKRNGYTFGSDKAPPHYVCNGRINRAVSGGIPNGSFNPFDSSVANLQDYNPEEYQKRFTEQFNRENTGLGSEYYDKYLEVAKKLNALMQQTYSANGNNNLAGWNGSTPVTTYDQAVALLTPEERQYLRFADAPQKTYSEAIEDLISRYPGSSENDFGLDAYGNLIYKHLWYGNGQAPAFVMENRLPRPGEALSREQYIAQSTAFHKANEDRIYQSQLDSFAASGNPELQLIAANGLEAVKEYFRISNSGGIGMEERTALFRQQLNNGYFRNNQSTTNSSEGTSTPEQGYNGDNAVAYDESLPPDPIPATTINTTTTTSQNTASNQPVREEIDEETRRFLEAKKKNPNIVLN